MRQTYNVAYIGNKFLNSYNAVQGINNFGSVSKSLTVDEFIASVRELIQNRYIDIYFIEKDSIVPSVNGTFIDAVEYLKLNTQSRIIVIAPNLTDPRSLNRLVSFGVYDIITDIQYTEDPMIEFTTNKAILESAIAHKTILNDVKHHLDYEIDIFKESDIKRISKGKVSKKSKNSTSIAILSSYDDSFKKQLTGIFNQDKNYFVEHSDVLSHQHFGDIDPSVQYLIIQDPTKQQLEQLTPPTTSLNTFFPIALYTSYAKYKSNKSEDTFAILYSDYTSETFIESLEQQIKAYQDLASLDDTTSIALSNFIPEGYVKKTPRWKLALMALLIIALMAGAILGVKKFYDSVIQGKDDQLIDVQQRLESEKMVLDFASNPYSVNPLEKIDFASLIKKQEEGAELILPEFLDEMTQKEGVFDVIYTLSKGDLKKEVVLNVIVKDTIAPVIKLSTGSIEIKEGEPVDGNKYVSSVVDNYEGDLRDRLEVSYEKNKTITYKVKDKAGNETVEKITVSVRKEVPVTKPGGGSSNNGGNSGGNKPVTPPPSNNGGNSGSQGPTTPPKPSGPIMIAGPDVIYVDRTDNSSTAVQQLNANLGQYKPVNAPGGGRITTDWSPVAYHRVGQYMITLKFSGPNGSTSRDVIVTVR